MPNTLIIILNVNSLNTTIKRLKLTEWLRRHHPKICCLQEMHFKYNGTGRFKVKQRSNHISKMTEEGDPIPPEKHRFNYDMLQNTFMRSPESG